MAFAYLRNLADASSRASQRWHKRRTGNVRQGVRLGQPLVRDPACLQQVGAGAKVILIVESPAINFRLDYLKPRNTI